MNLRLSLSNRPSKLVKDDCPYECGDEVPETGVYDVCHETEAGSAFFMRGTCFPECDCCGHNVRYKLSRIVPYIYEDEDFKR